VWPIKVIWLSGKGIDANSFLFIKLCFWKNPENGPENLLTLADNALQNSSGNGCRISITKKLLQVCGFILRFCNASFVMTFCPLMVCFIISRPCRTESRSRSCRSRSYRSPSRSDRSRSHRSRSRSDRSRSHRSRSRSRSYRSHVRYSRSVDYILRFLYSVLFQLYAH